MPAIWSTGTNIFWKKVLLWCRNKTLFCEQGTPIDVSCCRTTVSKTMQGTGVVEARLCSRHTQNFTVLSGYSSLQTSELSEVSMVVRIRHCCEGLNGL